MSYLLLHSDPHLDSLPKEIDSNVGKTWCRICNTFYNKQGFLNNKTREGFYNKGRIAECPKCIEKAGGGFYLVRIMNLTSEGSVSIMYTPFNVLWNRNVLTEKFSANERKNTVYKTISKYGFKKLYSIYPDLYDSILEFHHMDVCVESPITGFVYSLNEWHFRKLKTAEEWAIKF